MKAILLEEHGPPEVLKLVELADPEPGADEILVKAVAIGVGVPDVLVRSGRYGWMPKLPVVPGIEMTGVVARAGAAIEGIAVGDHVIVSAREREERGGCYAQYIAVKPSAVYKLPAGVDLDAAAALANYQVAWHMIHSASRTRPGDTVLVFGAAGGVGSAAVEVARLAELRPIAVVGGEQRVALVQRLEHTQMCMHAANLLAAWGRSSLPPDGSQTDHRSAFIIRQGFVEIMSFLAGIGSFRRQAAIR